jgi:hypothetical protein
MTVKHKLVRNSSGAPISASLDTYVYYKALRQDVSPKAANPNIIRFEDTDDVENLIEPVTDDNPLAVGMWLAILNSARAVTYGLGIDAVSADQPYGTTSAFTRAFELLESKKVYAIAPLTNDSEIGALALSHVDAMRLPESKATRICMFASEFPTRGVNKVVGSGSDGNTDTSSPKKFDTGIANLSQLLVASGIDPTAGISADDGLYLDITQDAKHYNISLFFLGHLFEDKYHQFDS